MSASDTFFAVIAGIHLAGFLVIAIVGQIDLVEREFRRCFPKEVEWFNGRNESDREKEVHRRFGPEERFHLRVRWVLGSAVWILFVLWWMAAPTGRWIRWEYRRAFPGPTFDDVPSHLDFPGRQPSCNCTKCACGGPR